MAYNPRTHGPNAVAWVILGKDAGLPTDGVLTNNQSLTLNAIPTDVPMMIDVSVTLSAGALTINSDLNATGTYVSADQTKPVSGTTETSLHIETSASNNWCCLNLLAGGSGATIAGYRCEVKGLFQDNYNPVKNGVNFLGADVDSGLYTFGPAAGGPPH